MKQYIDKSALVAEIERRKRTWQHQDQQYVNGGKDVCDYLLGFLDTLEVEEKPISDDLDEAARKAGQKYFPDEYNIWARPNYEAVKVEYAFKAGAKWQEEQMIGKACDWLEEHLLDFWSQRNTNTDYFIEEFKQAIEQ